MCTSRSEVFLGHILYRLAVIPLHAQKGKGTHLLHPARFPHQDCPESTLRPQDVVVLALRNQTIRIVRKLIEIKEDPLRSALHKLHATGSIELVDNDMGQFGFVESNYLAAVAGDFS